MINKLAILKEIGKNQEGSNLINNVLKSKNFRSVQNLNHVMRSKISLTYSDYYIEYQMFEQISKWITIDLRASREVLESPFEFDRLTKNTYYNIPLDPWNQPDWFKKDYNFGTNEEIAYRFFTMCCKEQIKKIMEVIIDEPFPILICCKHGKDRTGIIVMMLNLLTETSIEKIHEDYLKSEKDTRKELLDISLKIIEEQGGIIPYLKSCNLSDIQIEMLVKRLKGNQNVQIPMLDLDYKDDIKEYLKGFFTEYWKYLAVSAACKLNIFDELTNPKSVDEIFQTNMFQKYPNLKLLEYFLDGLVEMGFLNKFSDKYQTNAVSDYLTNFHESRLKQACILWSEEHLTAWQNLHLTIQSGQGAIKNAYLSDDIFKILNAFPEKRDKYHSALHAYAIDDYKFLPEIIDFSIHKSIMDVGGSWGILMRYIKMKFPSIEAYVFDLPTIATTDNFGNHLDIKPIEGDFFIEIPKKADAIILAKVLHDWNDINALKILQNVYDALPEDGYLYVIENCIDLTEIDLSLLNLNMFLMCESFERSSIEYRELAVNEGFKFIKSIPLNTLQTVLIFKK